MTRPISAARRLSRTTRRVALCAVWLAGATSAGPALAQESVTLPLSGAAYRVAQRAYDAYNRHDYAASIRAAREAIRQRPDVTELRLLLANALAASQRYQDASNSLDEAITTLGPKPALLARRAQIDAFAASIEAAAHHPSPPRISAANKTSRTGGGPDALNGPAFADAQRAYRAYAAKDYVAAVRFATQAIALRPDILRLRLLLIDTYSAAGNNIDAWAADESAVGYFGDSAALSVRRAAIGAILAPSVSREAYTARMAANLPQAIALLHQAIAYAPDRIGLRLQLFDALLAANDLPALDAAASAAIAQDASQIMSFALRGYARAAEGRFDEADADFTRALAIKSASPRDQRIARMIIADVWIAQDKPQQALRALASLQLAGDDTDQLILERRYRATRELKHPPVQPVSDASKSIESQRIARDARPISDCSLDKFGVFCAIYPNDPGLAVARAMTRALAKGDTAGAVKFARAAVAAAPDNAQYRIALVNVLVRAGDGTAATAQARQIVNAGLLSALPPLSAAYIAGRAGDNRIASDDFERADAEHPLNPPELADAGYAARHVYRNAEAAQDFKRSIDGTLAAGAPAGGAASNTTGNAVANETANVPSNTPSSASNSAPGSASSNVLATVTPKQLYDMRSAHADVTRDWGINMSVNYRAAGIQPGMALSPTTGNSNNWQTNVEAYWRPFGSLGDRMFEVYTRGYESFGVQGDGASGADTLDAALGVRAKPFETVDAVIALERLFPIGSAATGDWLARLGYSGGFGTVRPIGAPSWWTMQTYAEVGHYMNANTTYATSNIELGRSWSMDSISPHWTLFPHAVIGANYDNSIDRSVPVGAGAGIAARYGFRSDKYNTARSYLNISLQYRWRLAGDDRARGIFFGTELSY